MTPRRTAAPATPQPASPATPVPPVEHPRRPALKFNRELATQFGIDPNTPDPPRELVHVDRIPIPPDVAIDAQAKRGVTAAPTAERADVEDTIIHVIAEEMDELAERLERYHVTLSTAARQQLIDTALALLGGSISTGGAIAGH